MNFYCRRDDKLGHVSRFLRVIFRTITRSADSLAHKYAGTHTQTHTETSDIFYDYQFVCQF